MILEERIVFRTREQAIEFTEWLKQEGCRPKINEIFSSSIEVLAKGTFDTVDKWCRHMARQDKDKREMYQLIKENNRNYIDIISMIIDNSRTSGLLYTHDDLKASTITTLIRYHDLHQTEIPFEIPQYSSDIFNQEIFERYQLSVIHAILAEEGYVEETEEGYILATDKKTGDMITKTGVNVIADRPIPEFSGIEIVPGFLPEMQYEVSFSMPVYINVYPQQLEEVLSELGTEPDDIREYLNDYATKRNIVTLLLKMTENRGTVRYEELRETFEEFWETQTEKDGCKSKVSIMSELLEKFAAELKRAGYISIKNNRITPASKKSRRS